MQNNSDDSMKEILKDFVQEAETEVNTAVETLEILEDEGQDFETHLSSVAASIDRIMGAAQTLSLDEIGFMTKLAKEISYKSIQLKDGKLFPIVVAVLLDTMEYLETMMSELLTSGQKLNVQNLSNDTFKKRLRWLADKFKEVEHGSVQFKKDSSNSSSSASPLNQNSIDDLLKQMGI